MPSIDMGDDVTTPVNWILDSIPDGLKSLGTLVFQAVIQAVRPSTYQEEIPCYDHYKFWSRLVQHSQSAPLHGGRAALLWQSGP